MDKTLKMHLIKGDPDIYLAASKAAYYGRDNKRIHGHISYAVDADFKRVDAVWLRSNKVVNPFQKGATEYYRLSQTKYFVLHRYDIDLINDFKVDKNSVILLKGYEYSLEKSRMIFRDVPMFNSKMLSQLKSDNLDFVLEHVVS